MKTLIVGGTGMIGSHTALHLRDEGHHVTVAARTPVAEDSPVAGFPVLLGDYTAGTFTETDLGQFEAIVFAAGLDIRHKPKDADEDEFWERTQTGGVPRFVALAKRAGVGRVVQIGSYYHQVMPELVERDPYVRARSRADEGARALADADFNVSTLNPPSILGVIPGASTRRYAKIVDWADGALPDVPNFAPAGGTNYLSVRSLAAAVGGALQHAESGKRYLVGDANLTFREYFQAVFDAAGSSIRLEERDEEHPFMPDSAIVPGRGHVLSYEPDPADTELLGYPRGDVERALDEIVAAVRASRT
ncbi:NAD(P)-dependent oxidoreductase [Rhodococcus sp. D2-41]|uniref:NAD(P)-dependent oxidoreductase n=1 Tax=Speluncibacter jeojiensis TaxID=2710754 RepID=A0A9X4M0C2_9ACTN|nr:NAD(P)-dependent oxidoreductase [Rhodococcus sp. D2-41]MDG3009740.1 NAD(P)-dependent oxidoreductase [Rhodococcus sp. D2-41]MDG3014489.1 NAD(P)-dependent oxidoreductase [Corynebacteriales bacterium D3-21]